MTGQAFLVCVPQLPIAQLFRRTNPSPHAARLGEFISQDLATVEPQVWIVLRGAAKPVPPASSRASWCALLSLLAVELWDGRDRSLNLLVMKEREKSLLFGLFIQLPVRRVQQFRPDV